MQKPDLIIIAGCNGAGKSTYSSTFIEQVISFDFDKLFLKNYNKLIDSDFRSVMAQNETIEQFESAIQQALIEKKSFCYETNFDSNPLYWAIKAKESGYRTELHFYCLDTIETAKKRVDIRAKNNGHFVPDNTIAHKWKEGYKNLNLHFTFFDLVLLIDNSSETTIPTVLLELEKQSPDQFILRKYIEQFPEYAAKRILAIFSLIAE